ncbi:MAG: RagB/SusD family nutrient uptake outer membrane protein [Bacteroidales bacterium]|nr:RagB/SusD family nutrient uptake outer membrane protein [Bacteroidales bacterium]
MKKILLSLTIVAAGLFSACTEYLDMTPTDSVSDKVMWETTETAEYAVNYLYTYLWDIVSGQSAAGWTEAFTDQLKYGNYNYNANCFIPSEIAYGGSTLTAGYVDTYLGQWSFLYQGIMKVNQGLYNLKNYGMMPDEDKPRLEAEMRLIRGNMYFELMKRYKEVILYDWDITKYEKNKALSSEADGWEFIYQDFKYAADNLPAKADAAGRLDKGAAYAFLTRSMLYAERWQDVVDAYTEIKDLGYSLEKNYADATGKSVVAGNTEAILQYLFDKDNQTHSMSTYYAPGGDWVLQGKTLGGYGTPTQEMVESYEYATTGGFPDWSKWHGSTTETPPYAELEPRFHATILYNGADWKGRKIEPYVGGTDGWCQWNKEQAHKGRTTTGYYLRKLVDETHVDLNLPDVNPITIIRYAEVLLNAAEAYCRLENTAGANALVKEIRSRVGLPYTDKSGDALFAAIRQERRVELAFEGLWYWDLRRWNVAASNYPEGLNNYQVHGLKIEKTGEDEYIYTYVSVDDKDRNFPERMVDRFPLPQSELDNNADVNQFTEWN